MPQGGTSIVMGGRGGNRQERSSRCHRGSGRPIIGWNSIDAGSPRQAAQEAHRGADLSGVKLPHPRAPDASCDLSEAFPAILACGECQESSG